MSNSNRKRGTPPEKLAYWRDQVAGWRASGLNQAEYCRREDVSPSSLGLWVRRFAREQGAEDTTPVIVAVSPQQLAPAMPKAAPAAASLRLHVGERFQVDVPEGFAAPALRKLLDVLAEMERSA